jgi:hypothetical protein
MTSEVSPQILAISRLRFAPVEGAAELCTPDFVDYLLRLHDEFTGRIHRLHGKRGRGLSAAAPATGRGRR